MEQITRQSLPPGMGFEWSALSYQEKLVGNQMYFVFAFGLLLVYLVLAGQYESWYAPISIVLAVPLSLIGPVLLISALVHKGLSNNLYVQIGLVLLIALSAKNAILIVEFARDLRAEGKSDRRIGDRAARARFRPILMTSFAFILGVVPLVFATGAGAGARKSIGITVFSGMLASTCLAVLFVPAFFVLVQRFEESRKARKNKPARKRSGGGINASRDKRSGPYSHNLDAASFMLITGGIRNQYCWLMARFILGTTASALAVLVGAATWSARAQEAERPPFLLERLFGPSDQRPAAPVGQDRTAQVARQRSGRAPRPAGRPDPATDRRDRAIAVP